MKHVEISEQTSVYLQLCAVVFRHELHRALLDDLKVPRAEDLHGQDAIRFVDSKTATERLGHAVSRNKCQIYEPQREMKLSSQHLYTRMMQVMKNDIPMVKK